MLTEATLLESPKRKVSLLKEVPCPLPCSLLSWASSSLKESCSFTAWSFALHFSSQLSSCGPGRCLKSAARTPAASPCSTYNRDEGELIWGSLEKGVSSDESPVPEITDTEERPGCLRSSSKTQRPRADAGSLHLQVPGKVLTLNHTQALLSPGIFL